jgi:hypothetical protein
MEDDALKRNPEPSFRIGQTTESSDLVPGNCRYTPRSTSQDDRFPAFSSLNMQTARAFDPNVA